LLELHRALSAGDPTAPARLADLLLLPLTKRTRVSGADAHRIESACGLALARYFQEPHRYDPDRGPLLAWLVQDARGDVLNELASSAARHERLEGDRPGGEVVELRPGERNVFQDRAQVHPVEDDALDRADPHDLPAERLEAIRQELRSLEPLDRAVAELIGEGVRETAAYSEVLGITHLPVEQQRAAVKREKDRIGKRLERLRERI
jgi:hypothetical protein